jgi:hypothetical protein
LTKTKTVSATPSPPEASGPWKWTATTPTPTENWFVYESCVDDVDNDCDFLPDLLDRDCPSGPNECLILPDIVPVTIRDRGMYQSLVFSLEKQGHEVSPALRLTIGDMRAVKHLEVDQVPRAARSRTSAP